MQAAHSGNKDAATGHNDVCAVWAKARVLYTKCQRLGCYGTKNVFNGVAR
jgi:hypothetical protein